jgi:mRNA interferase RelE/StbE
MELLPREVHRRVAAKIVNLEMNPRPAGIRKLQGTEGYRLRVGDYRVLYTVDDRSHTIIVYSVVLSPLSLVLKRQEENCPVPLFRGSGFCDNIA